jgi:hypothetical protein
VTASCTERPRPGLDADDPTPDAQLTRLDPWIVERHTFYLAMDLDTLMDSSTTSPSGV